VMAANYRHIGGAKNRLGPHYSRFSAVLVRGVPAAQSPALRKIAGPCAPLERRARGATELCGRSARVPLPGAVISVSAIKQSLVITMFLQLNQRYHLTLIC
jgi:hypothetical protein